tara:strand:- start:989 stop:1702 length:714 start_codon:yes stop_codon:yes gene_type:complete
MITAKELEAMTKLGASFNNLFERLLCYEIANSPHEELLLTRLYDSAKKGSNVFVAKPRFFAHIIEQAKHVLADKYMSTIATETGLSRREIRQTYDWEMAEPPERDGSQKFLRIIDTVRQSFIERGFKFEVTWEVIEEYKEFHNEKNPPHGLWSDAYDSTRSIPITKESATQYPGLKLPDKAHWYLVRPIITIRWQKPSDEEIETTAEKYFRKLTMSEQEQALDSAIDIEDSSRMLRI